MIGGGMGLEILAPAGNAACAKAAIHAGADAIYLGVQSYSARQGAENFDTEQLREVIAYAHFCNVKVYVAMNTLVKDDELQAFLQTVLSVWETGADAIILQDVLLGKALHTAYPQIVLHLSTQAGICNADGALLAKAYGFSRVILARETPLSEIAEIAKIIETEAFVQGALCTAYSGQCYFSSFVGGNSGNRGRCKQPCRKLYAYDRNGGTEKAYALSLSDLCVGEYIEKYIQAGVTSFKIEGRMRRAEYVSAAVGYYRTLLDGKVEQDGAKALSNLKRTYNRGNYTKGLAFGQDKRLLSTAVQGHIGEKVGVVKVVNGKYYVESGFMPVQGDAFKILRDGKEVCGAFFQKRENRGFTLSCKYRLKNGDGVFVTTDTSLNARLLDKTRRGKLELSLYFKENEYARVSGGGIELFSEEKMQSATAQALTVEEVQACFLKTDGLPVDVVFSKTEVQGKIFIPKSKLNAFRRLFYEKLRQNAVKNEKLLRTDIPLPAYEKEKNNDKIAVISDDFVGVDAQIAIYKPTDYRKALPESFVSGKFEKFVVYPALCTRAERDALAAWCALGIGVYAENYGAIVFAKEYGVDVFVGTGLNIFNRLSVMELRKESCVKYYALSKELTATEQQALSDENAFVLGVGDIKLMELCYCPFGKTCAGCDKKSVYTLTDENGRAFPVRRYVDANGNCRFEVYNCAALLANVAQGALLDLTLVKDKNAVIAAQSDTEKQKKLFEKYTSGHAVRGVL